LFLHAQKTQFLDKTPAKPRKEIIIIGRDMNGWVDICSNTIEAPPNSMQDVTAFYRIGGDNFVKDNSTEIETSTDNGVAFNQITINTIKDHKKSMDVKESDTTVDGGFEFDQTPAISFYNSTNKDQENANSGNLIGIITGGVVV